MGSDVSLFIGCTFVHILVILLLMSRSHYAFIDSQNVNLATRDLGWVLDWARFRRYLKDKYGVEKAFSFIGFVPGNEGLYRSLQEAGFILIFKPTLEIKKGKESVVKGNVDAELVLHTMIEWNNYDKALIASGDGDFHCLIEHLSKHKKLLRLLIPNQRKFSSLLRVFGSHISFMNHVQHRLQKQGAHSTRGIAAGRNPLVDPSS